MLATAPPSCFLHAKIVSSHIKIYQIRILNGTAKYIVLENGQLI